MKRSISRFSTWSLAATLLVNAVLPIGTNAANGHDDPGTQVTNSASATYKDAAGNSYNTTSNIVTTTVQNAPTLTNVSGTGTSYAPGQSVTDTFVLTNTGNAAGAFQVSGSASAPTSSSDAVIAGSDAGSVSLGNNAATCTTPAGSQSAPCKYSATVGGTTSYFTSLDGTSDNNSLDYWLQNTNPATAAGASITVNVFYTLAVSATTPGTVSSQIFATTAYPPAGGAPAELSASVSATESNTVIADARLDLYKSSAQNGGTGDITYTISAHNGGAFAAKDLQSVKALLGSATTGILITDKVPQFAGSALHLSNSGTVTFSSNPTYGYPSGATGEVWYSTAANGASSWTKAGGNLPTDGSVTYIGIFVHGGTCGSAGFDLCSDTGHPTNPGNANVAAAAAIQFAFTIVQPAGPGSANSGSVTNLANGVVGDNQPTEHILGPGIPGGTADGPSSTPLTTAGQGINNTTNTSVNGASNQVANQALSSYAPLNGPLGVPGATGSYDGVAASNNTDDFTAFPFGLTGDTVANTSTTPGSPTTAATLGTGGQTVCVPNTLQNNGNHDDAFNIVANVPLQYQLPLTSGGTAVSGWKVGIYSNAACSSALGGAVDGISSSTASNVAITSGNSQNYYTKYVIPVGAPYFYRFDSLIVATSVGDNTKTNNTHDELYSGFIALTKSQSVTTTGCPAGVTPTYAAGTVCPTGVLQYIVDYRNLVMGTTSTNVSFSAVTTQSGTLQVTDDGTLSVTSQTTVPNWASFATMTSAPVDTTSGTSYTYYTGIPASGGGSSSFSVNDTKFVDLIGGASFQLVPKNYLAPAGTQGNQGTVTFSIAVK
ncbi:MAG: hypothetical protein M3R51_09365 [Candidatus Eremiobacteraeota bacterium]|nr:hypothetical protein [Candidatus Eremiobacteraeota bacterium]